MYVPELSPIKPNKGASKSGMARSVYGLYEHYAEYDGPQYDLKPVKLTPSPSQNRSLNKFLPLLVGGSGVLASGDLLSRADPSYRGFVWPNPSRLVDEWLPSLEYETPQRTSDSLGSSLCFSHPKASSVDNCRSKTRRTANTKKCQHGSRFKNDAQSDYGSQLHTLKR
jgi:hypothetical protein